MSRLAVLALSSCVLAAGCSDTGRPVSRSAGTPAGSGATTQSMRPDPSPPGQAPSSPTAAGPSFAAGSSAQEQPARGGPLSVVAVRVANHGSFDRVVFELKGRDGGEPGWRVEYVDQPSADGSGDPVAVGGAAALAVRISGAGYPDDTGAQDAESVGGPGGAAVVEDVVLGATFEGVYEAWIGTARKAPFRVFRLADPARVVIDVQHG